MKILGWGDVHCNAIRSVVIELRHCASSDSTPSDCPELALSRRGPGSHTTKKVGALQEEKRAAKGDRQTPSRRPFGKCREGANRSDGVFAVRVPVCVYRRSELCLLFAMRAVSRKVDRKETDNSRSGQQFYRAY